MVESLEEISIREVESTSGVGFRDQVQKMKAQKAFFEELEQSNPSLAKIAESYQKFHGAREEETRALKFMRQGPPYRIHDPNRRLFQAPEWPQDDRTEFYLQFNGGHGYGALDSFADVTGVSDGLVGWRMPDIWIENRNTDTTVISNLHLGWSVDIPRDGAYIFRNELKDVEVDVASRTDGSGLWGLDAKVEVEYHTFAWLTGGPALAPVHWSVLYSEAGRLFGPQVVTHGTGAYPLPREVPFVAQRGHLEMAPK